MSWANIQSSITSLNLGSAGANFGQTAGKFARSTLQSTKERLGQVSADDITELPQGECYDPAPRIQAERFSIIEYKDLEARVDALRAAHQSLLKCVAIA